MLVLMPPPVELEEAPMNMSTISKNSMGMPTAPMSTVLKPLVRVTLWNTAVVNFPNQDIPSRVPCHSSAP